MVSATSDTVMTQQPQGHPRDLSTQQMQSPRLSRLGGSRTTYTVQLGPVPLHHPSGDWIGGPQLRTTPLSSTSHGSRVRAAPRLGPQKGTRRAHESPAPQLKLTQCCYLQPEGKLPALPSSSFPARRPGPQKAPPWPLSKLLCLSEPACVGPTLQLESPELLSGAEEPSAGRLHDPRPHPASAPSELSERLLQPALTCNLEELVPRLPVSELQ